jgi:thiamine-phosphate pyrophosphorylase
MILRQNRGQPGVKSRLQTLPEADSMPCLLHYITDRKAFRGDESARRRLVLEKIAEAARCGVDFVQLREKDLPSRELEQLAEEAFAVVCENAKPTPGQRRRRTRLLINSRTDVALAVAADGVHLRADDVSPLDVRRVWKSVDLGPKRIQSSAGPLPNPVVGVSCHTPDEVVRAAAAGADYALFAPVFEKKDVPGARPAGLARLQAACQSASIPVFALGGVSLENARSCVEARAAGIAGIRLFQENSIADIVRQLRSQPFPL